MSSDISQPKWLYRLESASPDNGLWYSADGQYVFGIGRLPNCKTKDLPMGYDERYRKGGRHWFSSCSREEDLTHWYSLEDALDLMANGFVFTRYLATEYTEYEYETTFIKDSCLKREVIDPRPLFAKRLWEDLEDVPLNPETECIEVDWRDFPAGTHREDIWHWFEKYFGVHVADLMYEASSL